MVNEPSRISSLFCIYNKHLATGNFICRIGRKICVIHVLISRYWSHLYNRSTIFSYYRSRCDVLSGYQPVSDQLVYPDNYNRGQVHFAGVKLTQDLAQQRLFRDVAEVVTFESFVIGTVAVDIWTQP